MSTEETDKLYDEAHRLGLEAKRLSKSTHYGNANTAVITLYGKAYNRMLEAAANPEYAHNRVNMYTTAAVFASEAGLRKEAMKTAQTAMDLYREYYGYRPIESMSNTVEVLKNFIQGTF
jgi:hypothetical protein